MLNQQFRVWRAFWATESRLRVSGRVSKKPCRAVWLNRQTTCISLLWTSLHEGSNAIFLHLNKIAEKHHINAEFVNIKCQWTVRQLIFCQQCCIGRQKLQCCTELKINVEFNIYLPQVFNFFFDVFGIDKKMTTAPMLAKHHHKNHKPFDYSSVWRKKIQPCLWMERIFHYYTTVEEKTLIAKASRSRDIEKKKSNINKQ